MPSLIIGPLILLAVTYAAVSGHATTNYFATHSTLIVLGGTIGVLFCSAPLKVLVELFKSVQGLFQADETMAEHKPALDVLSTNKLSSITTQNPMLKYASELWSQGVEEELFVVLLSQKRRELNLRSQDAVQVLKNLSKYPPALGMTGTVIGMMGLFADLDKNKETIGQNLSIAMTATFLGLAMANLVISPLADRLQISQAKSQQVGSHLYELLLLINRNESKSLIEEEINGRAA